MTTGWFARAARLKTLPVALWPVAFGVFAAPGHGGDVAVRVALAVSATAALHLAMHLGVEMQDARWGAGKIARMERGSIPTGAGAVQGGLVSLRRLEVIWAGSLLAAVLPWLGVGDDAAALGLVAGLGVAVGLWLPRMREALFAVAAVCPFLAVYDAFGASIVRGLVPAVIPFGFALATFLAMSMLQWRADLAVRHPTLASLLQPERALIVAGVSLTAAYSFVVLSVALDRLPMLSLLALASAPPAARALGRTLRDPAPQHVLRLLGATLGAGLLTGFALIFTTALS